MSYALRYVVERSRRAVTLKTLFESLYGGSIYCLYCEFVPGFYSAYEEWVLVCLYSGALNPELLGVPSTPSG